MKPIFHNILSALTIAFIIGFFKTAASFSLDLEAAKLEITFLKEQLLSMRGDLSEIKTDVKELIKGSQRGK